MPQVTVLLATFQGVAFLEPLLDSVLGQQGVDVRLVVSDDGSDDGTWERLQARAAADSRVSLLPRLAPTGRAASNFYRLLRDASWEGLVAFADQDDVWELDKLARHASHIEQGADGVSSNVWTLSPTGERALLRKDYPQREWDWVFEGPGPGCSFLLTARLASLVSSLVEDPVGLASSCDYHDWLTYAVCRARGWTWVIDAHPSVDYRQHATNVMGANKGLGAARERLRLARAGWHRKQAADLVRLGQTLAPSPDGSWDALLGALSGTGPGARLRLVRRVAQARRRPRDRAILGALVAGGIW